MEPEQAKMVIRNEVSRRISDLDAARTKELRKLDDARRDQRMAEGWVRTYQVEMDKLYKALAVLDNIPCPAP